MAKITELVILNPSDKTRMYAVLTGKGTPTDADDVIVTNVRDFPVGSQYTDLTGKKFFVRVAVAKAATDWKEIGAAVWKEIGAAAAGR